MIPSTSMDGPVELAAMRVQDERGGAVRLDALWAERPAVIALVRHFG